MIAGAGISSTTEFIVFVMRSIASTGNITKESKTIEKEARIVRERLKRLGYL